jgi:hypothetical protein
VAEAVAGAVAWQRRGSRRMGRMGRKGDGRAQVRASWSSRTVCSWP